MDDFFDFNEKASDRVGKSLSEDIEKPEVIQEEKFFKERKLPELVGNDYPERFLKLVETVRDNYKNLPDIDYAEIREELDAINVSSCSTPTLQTLNYEMEKVQAAKDRVSEIFTHVIPAYNFKKRITEMLMSCWNEYATGKTKDLRESDSTMRLSEFLIDFHITEAANSACTQVLRNLDSLHNTLSRRITIFQLQLSLRDVGRGSMPDFQFSPESSGDEIPQDIADVLAGASESLAADEEGF